MSSIISLNADYTWDTSEIQDSPILVCSSVENPFIPLYVYDDSIRYSEDVVIWKLPLASAEGEGVKTSKFKRYCNAQRTNHVKYDNATYFIRKSLVYTYDNMGNVVFLLVGVADKDFHLGRGARGEAMLLIHPLVFNGVKFKNLKYYVNKYFINETTSRGCEVRITENIAEMCFNPMSNAQEFSSIKEKNAYLKSIRRHIGTQGEDELLPVYPPTPEELEAERLIIEPAEEPVAQVRSTAVPGQRTEVRRYTIGSDPVQESGGAAEVHLSSTVIRGHIDDGFWESDETYEEDQERPMGDENGVVFLSEAEVAALNNNTTTIQYLRTLHRPQEVQVPLHVMDIMLSGDGQTQMYTIRLDTGGRLVVPEEQYNALVRGDHTVRQVMDALHGSDVSVPIHNTDPVNTPIPDEPPVGETPAQAERVSIDELRAEFGDLADIAAEFADAEEPVADVPSATAVAMAQAIAEQERLNTEMIALGERTHEYADSFSTALGEVIEELPDDPPPFPVWRTLQRRGTSIDIIDDTIYEGEDTIQNDEAGQFRFPSTLDATTTTREGYQLYLGTGGDMEGTDRERDDFLRWLHTTDSVGINVTNPTTPWIHAEYVVDLDDDEGEDSPYFFVDDESEIL